MKNLANSQSNGNNRIYISRNRSNRRKITNEKDLINVLKKYKFKIIYSEKISFEKQIKIFSNTKYILGLHGAGLSNLIWMKKKSYLIEIKPEIDLYLNCYFNLASLLNLNYHYLICKKKNMFVSSKNSNYEVDLSELKKRLDKIFK
jgi:capsular polysaccharide biosynthesis protein